MHVVVSISLKAKLEFRDTLNNEEKHSHLPSCCLRRIFFLNKYCPVTPRAEKVRNEVVGADLYVTLSHLISGNFEATNPIELSFAPF